jgi:hypothetical protein
LEAYEELSARYYLIFAAEVIKLQRACTTYKDYTKMTDRFTSFISISGLVIIAALFMQPNRSVASEPTTGNVATGGQVYLAEFSSSDNALKVAVDGMLYRGFLASHTVNTESAQDSNLQGPLGAGKWGRAFLFASSAKVIQCRIDSGFPELTGLCLDADGRNYKLLSANR